MALTTGIIMSVSDFDRELLAIEKRKNEHALIAMATQELFDDKKDVGSWGKALMESEGNIDLANSLYLKHRVQKLQDELSEDLLKKAKEKHMREEEARAKAAYEAEMELKNAAEKVGTVAYYDKQIQELMNRYKVIRQSDLIPLLNIRVSQTGDSWSYDDLPTLRAALEKRISGKG